MSRSTAQHAIDGVRSVSISLPRLRIEHLWMLVPAMLVTWMGFLHPLRRLDFWWHLKVGEIIYSTRHIPRVDLFSFVKAGQPFIHQAWLGELMYYLAYRAGGFPLLIAFNTVLLLLTLIPIYHLCFEAGDRLYVGVACSLIPALVLGLYSNVRPQVYSFVFFAAFYWILWQYRERRRDYLWGLPLLMVLWVNLHGAFVLGIGMIGLVLVSEALRRALAGSPADALGPRALAKLALVLGVTLVATLVNPETYRVYAYVHEIQTNPVVQRFVVEWQVPDIKELSRVLTFFGPFLLTLLVLLYTRRRLDLTELGLFIVFAALGFSATRNGIWFALIAAPILSRHVVDMEVPDLLDKRSHRPHPDGVARPVADRKGRPRLNWVVLMSMLAFTILLSPWVRPRLHSDWVSSSLFQKGTPVGAMDYIAEHGLVGHIFHPQYYGDYLIWRLWPQQRSFYDGRVHLYDESFVQDYILTFHDDNWESRLAKYDIKYLLLPKDDKSAASMIEEARESENWVLLYEDDISVLFGRGTRS